MSVVVAGRVRRSWRWRAVALLATSVLLVVLAVGAATPALATVTGGCRVNATSTSGGPADLTAIRVWHLRSTDHVTATATAPSQQTSVTVRAYALGFALPVASGTSDGTTQADATDYEIKTFAILGRVFVVSGSSGGPASGCAGEVIIVLDDVNPLTTVLGAGGVIAIVIGILILLWSTRKPVSVMRRLLGLGSLILIGAGLSLVLQQTSTPALSPNAVSSLGRSSWVDSVPRPTSVSLDSNVLAQSALLTLIVVFLLPFPSTLFNKTLEENYDAIRAGIRRRRLTSWLVRGTPPPPIAPETQVAMAGGVVPSVAVPQPPAELIPRESRARRLLTVAFVVVAAGVLYAVLDPGFGKDTTRSLVTFAGIVAGLVAVTWVAALPSRSLHTVLAGDRGKLWAPPGVLLVAALCVLISRLVDFQPGYLYGLILGFAFSSTLDAKNAARGAAASAWWMIGLAFAAWLTLGAVRMPGLEDSVPAEIAASVLAAMVTAGVEAIVFELVPIRFLPGDLVFKWRRFQWFVLYALGVFGFAWIILNPTNGFLTTGRSPSLFTALALFVSFGIVSVLFWGWFRFRGGRREA